MENRLKAESLGQLTSGRVRNKGHCVFCHSSTYHRVKSGNWHVFPIDNPFTWARMAIAGARALSFPPRLKAREPK